ncbi:hypothetical protein WDU94_015375 [Cyamophila willieti]
MVSLLIILYILLVLAISLCIVLSHAPFLRSHCICSSSHTPDTSLKHASRADKCYAFISKQIKDKCRVLPAEIDSFNEHLRHVTDVTYVTEQISKCVTPSLSCLKQQLIRNAKEMACLVPPELSQFSTLDPSSNQFKYESPRRTNYPSKNLDNEGRRTNYPSKDLDYVDRQPDYPSSHLDYPSSHLDYPIQEYFLQNHHPQRAREEHNIMPSFYSSMSMSHLSQREQSSRRILSDLLHPPPPKLPSPTSHCSLSELSTCSSDEDDAYLRCCPPVDPAIRHTCKVAKRNRCEECCQSEAILKATYIIANGTFFIGAVYLQAHALQCLLSMTRGGLFNKKYEEIKINRDYADPDKGHRLEQSGPEHSTMAKCEG